MNAGGLIFVIIGKKKVISFFFFLDITYFYVCSNSSSPLFLVLIYLKKISVAFINAHERESYYKVSSEICFLLFQFNLCKKLIITFSPLTIFFSLGLSL